MINFALFSSFFRWLWLCRVRALKSVAVAVGLAVAGPPAGVAVAGAVGLSLVLPPNEQNITQASMG